MSASTVHVRRQGSTWHIFRFEANGPSDLVPGGDSRSACWRTTPTAACPQVTIATASEGAPEIRHSDNSTIVVRKLDATAMLAGPNESPLRQYPE
jgi:hypothetical protein